jgi:hypothetical protein
MRLSSRFPSTALAMRRSSRRTSRTLAEVDLDVSGTGPELDLTVEVELAGVL